MEKTQSDFIAKAIDEKNKEVVTKAETNNINKLIFGLGAVTITGFGFLYSSLNAIISKLG